MTQPVPLTPEDTARLAGARRIAIWGAGAEGMAVLDLLAAHGWAAKTLMIADSAPPPETLARLAAHGLEAPLLPADGLAQLDAHGLLIRSPGVSIHRPEFAQLAARGVPWTTATNLAIAALGPGRCVAITGTKGKSTTAALTHLALSAEGEAVLCGNIGVPVLTVLGRAGPGVTPVIELSSYQVSDLTAVPQLRVLTNLFPEHLDWHGSAEAYFHDKTRLFTAGPGISLVNGADPEAVRRAAGWEGVRWFNHSSGVHLRGETYHAGDTALGTAPRLAEMGAHVQIAACAALAVALEKDVPAEVALAAMDRFAGLPHRQQILGQRDGVLYVNDSISTIPQSALAALDRFGARSPSLILGGVNRGIDYSPLIERLETAPLACLACVGKAGAAVLGALRRDDIPARHFAEFADAVAFARAHAAPGGCVLLSPAAASYDRFANFQERGEAFAQLCGFSSAAPSTINGANPG